MEISLNGKEKVTLLGVFLQYFCGFLGLFFFRAKTLQ